MRAQGSLGSLQVSAVGLVGLGGTLVGLAFTLRPVSAAPAVFWGVVAVGGALCLMAFVDPFIRFRRRQTPLDQGRHPSEQERAARECRRLASALNAFVRLRALERPRVSRYRRRSAEAAWEIETARRYQLEYRAWARRVFDEALDLGAVSASARALIEDPGANQIADIGELFSDLAGALENGSAV